MVRRSGALFLGTASRRQYADLFAASGSGFDGVLASDGSARIGWTACVPPGSIAKGREIVTTGGVMRVGSEVVPRTTACAGCHGTDLMGMDDAPPLAGPSASYFASAVRRL